MKGINIAEQLHVVNILPPIDIDTASGFSSDVIHMGKHAHVSIIILVGVAVTATFTVEECDDFVPTNVTAIPFSAYKEETALGDTLGSRVAVTAAGMASHATIDNMIYVIEIDASQLTEGRPCIRLVGSNPSAASIISAVAILSGARFGSDLSATVIA